MEHKARPSRRTGARARKEERGGAASRIRKMNGYRKPKADRGPQIQGDLQLNEERYVRILESSIFPPWGLFRASLREDYRFILPRIIHLTFRTVERIPKSLFMPRCPRRDRYVFETLDRWAKQVCKLCQMKLEIRGREHIDPVRTYLFVANHMSPVDIPAIYAALPQKAAFVANDFFSRIPVFSYWMKSSGAVFVKQGDSSAEMKSFRSMVKRLKKGRSLVLFPEGHIYQGAGLDEFKRGGIHSALFAGVPIVPLCLYGTQDVIFPGSLQAAPRKKVVVEFGQPIEPGTLSRDQRKRIDNTLHDTLDAMKREISARHIDATFFAR